MSVSDKLFYNEASAAKLGWTPRWFGCKEFDDNLIDSIADYQSKNGLTADGLCGPGTYRRIFTERESKIQTYCPTGPRGNGSIIYAGNPFKIEWDKVSLWSEPGALKANTGTYQDMTGYPLRNPTFFVNHWDVCLSSTSCAQVLNNRGISVHFCIDNDGTIHQMLDIQHIAWHAGGTVWNQRSIGVEVSDAYDLKYQSWYEAQGLGERPIWSDKKVHGTTLSPFLGFYPVQLEALKALWKAVSNACNIPLDSPVVADGVDPTCAAGDFKGFCSHYNLTRNKIDCAGLDIKNMLEEI